jgi:hypothetical protein
VNNQIENPLRQWPVPIAAESPHPFLLNIWIDYFERKDWLNNWETRYLLKLLCLRFDSDKVRLI